MKILKEFIKFYADEIKLNEGLVSTANIYKAKNILEKKFGEYFEFTLRGMSATTLQDLENTLLVKSKRECPIEVFDEFTQWANNFGWFISELTYDFSNRIKFKDGDQNKIYKYNKYVYFDSIILEAKYDEEIDPIPKKLYHITKPQNENKILKIGLNPKLQGKLSNHPEKIYFGFTEHDVIQLAKMFKMLSSGGTYVLFEIDTDLVPAYLRLFADPNYHGKGCYTMNNIPPSAIVNKKIIVV